MFLRVLPCLLVSLLLPLTWAEVTDVTTRGSLKGIWESNDVTFVIFDHPTFPLSDKILDALETLDKQANGKYKVAKGDDAELHMSTYNAYPFPVIFPGHSKRPYEYTGKLTVEAMRAAIMNEVNNNNQ